MEFSYLVQIEVFVGGEKSVLVAKLLIESRQKFVEDVVIPFVGRLRHDPALFQKILRHSSSDDHTAEQKSK